MKTSLKTILYLSLFTTTLGVLGLVPRACAEENTSVAPITEAGDNSEPVSSSATPEPAVVDPTNSQPEIFAEPSPAIAAPTNIRPESSTNSVSGSSQLAPSSAAPGPAIAAPTNIPPENSTSTNSANSQSENSTTPNINSALGPNQVRILTPTDNSLVDVPATTVILQFQTDAKVTLRVNGVAVDPSAIGRTETDSTNNLTTQTWYGIALKDGENTITARAETAGVTGPIATVKVQVRGTVKQITVETVEAYIPADGRSTATVQGQLLDERGNRSNRDAVVTLVASAGEFTGADYDLDQPGFQVQARQGQFTAALRSSLQAKTARIRATTGDLEAFSQIEFQTNLRPSIVTGVVDLRIGGRGTDYYGSFRDFMPPDGDNGTKVDLRTAVFATGRIGEWLVTGAYNSERPLNQTCDGENRLFRDVQFCDQNYPVYGDSSTVTTVTPSTDHLYLRLERTSPTPGAGTDYAMWGDYNTEEFATQSQQFTATTRQLHGFKLNYNFGNLQLSGFYGNNVEGFQRDTIAPDGTSGYYFLSRRLLVGGSENVFIELEELDRPGTVLERKELNRGTDYEIDYDRGALLFRRPLLRTDVDDEGRVLVRRIVITYQYENSGADTNIYGGRLRYHFSRELNHESWLGATYLRENQGSRKFELYGADALVSFGRDGRLIAEYAHSSNDSEVLGPVSGSAYRIEAESTLIEGIRGRAYYRSADTGFANNATISFVPGQTRYGLQLAGQVSSTTNVRVQYDHEDNRGIAPRPLNNLRDLFNPGSEAIPGSRVDNSLTTISVGVQQRLGAASLEVDWINRHREDRLATEDNDITSSQLRSRLTVPLASNLTFRAQNELNLSSQVDTVYPDRTIFGLAWQVMPGITVELNHQFFSGGQFRSNSITSLDINGDYKLGSDTTVSGRFSIINGQSMAGAIGIQQGWTIAPGLRADFSYEHVFGDIYGRTGAGARFPQPYAVGQSASALGVQGGDSYSVGLAYTDNPDFQASVRYEHRSSSEGSNTVISASATGKISPAITALFRYQQANSSNQLLRGLGDTVNLRFGLAYRDPNDDRLNVLLRYDYRKNPATTPGTILLGTGTGYEDHTFAIEALYAPDWRWEFYGKYALRHSTSQLAQDLVGTSTVSLTQLRATYRLNYRMDLVGEARWINQPSAGYSETGFTVEAGYYLTPNLRLYGGYSFGGVNDRDFDGTRSGGGFYGGIVVKLNELFNGFGLQRVAPRQQRESQAQPVTAEPSPASQTAASNLIPTMATATSTAAITSTP
ncbi:TonB-dependent receptor [Leptolyngbya sp. FACHB-261]|uniref:TonB-dependent receptor n=1 Tax=Leptolyngbya sp. FACHB-261 TaxID=2692806 RepID=UPI001683C075|nr:TonB-dependent receptor [Leptolyngbya sp. FACHB-261]MBD2101038.1 TonB-dependent receptor [Leptolyngbya sp. FACHB-261]